MIWLLSLAFSIRHSLASFFRILPSLAQKNPLRPVASSGARCGCSLDDAESFCRQPRVGLSLQGAKATAIDICAYAPLTAACAFDCTTYLCTCCLSIPCEVQYQPQHCQCQNRGHKLRHQHDYGRTFCSADCFHRCTRRHICSSQVG